MENIIVSSGSGVEVLFYDKHIVVCLKPAGVLSEGDSEGSLPLILSRFFLALGEAGDIFPVHRLDRETAGIMVLARTKKAAAALSSAFADKDSGGVEKIYLALLCGTPSEDEATLTDLLFFDRTKNKSFAVKKERKGVKSASLEYSVLRRADGKALVRVKLHTGRTHQIRVQFASRGLPLAGDRRYGAPADSGRELRLFAASLSFPHPEDGRPMSFSADPDW